MYTYNTWQWLAFFYLYCFFGWIFESAYVSFKERRPVNRGFLRLPLLPLYGFGAVMMLWVSLPVKDNFLLVYFSGVIAATALEYITGYVMERLFRVRYWDYSNKRFQIHGYICLTSSLAWGGLTILMTEVIHQPVSRAVLDADPLVLKLALSAVSVLFAADSYESTKEALALGQALEAMTKMRGEMEEIQMRMMAFKEEAADKARYVRAEAAKHLSAMGLEAEEKSAALLAEQSKKLSAARAETKELAASFCREAAERLDAIHESSREHLMLLAGQLEDIKQKRLALHPKRGLRHFYRKGLLRGNPGAVSPRFSEALKELLRLHL